MKESKAYLKRRWETDWQPWNDVVVGALKNKGDLLKLGLPMASEGLIDLRGFSAPKEYTTEKTNSGREKTYVSEGIRIKKMRFEGVDFSYADFEGCTFHNCHFKASVFHETRLVNTQYWGCSFQELDFHKTNFGHATFQIEGTLLKRSVENFVRVRFDQANLKEVRMHGQYFGDCQISNCKTDALIFGHCGFEKVAFEGEVKDMTVKASRKVVDFDLTASQLVGFNLQDQGVEGFHFPGGDKY
ncbi:MAG TPA: hypothetical protein DCE41_37555 [Cytophagales bacterium]|nr:hypothetical protein [Cytophagales bacterium]HAA18910.1 hypothetical protein [Cytophagales bacterium]HAP62561.1 hypothetical protein [Cytophagales bacterium]